MSDENNNDNNVVDLLSRMAKQGNAERPEQEQISEEMQKALHERQQMILEALVQGLMVQERVTKQAAVHAVHFTQQESVQLQGFYQKRFETEGKELWGFFGHRGSEQSTKIVALKESTTARHIDELVSTALVLAILESQGARMFLHAHGIQLQFFEAPIPEQKSKLII